MYIQRLSPGNLKVEQYSPAGDETSLALKLLLSGHDFDFKTDDGGMGSVEKMKRAATHHQNSLEHNRIRGPKLFPDGVNFPHF